MAKKVRRLAAGGEWIRTISSARADTDVRMWISASKRGELVDLVGDWALTFAAAACDLVHCRSRSGRHDETRAELRLGLYRAMADHRDGRVGRDRPGRIGAHYLKWQGKLAPSKPISTCATARAMALPAPSSPRKASMTAPPPAAAAGLWGAPADPRQAHPLDRCREARAKAYGSMWGLACATYGAEVQISTIGQLASTRAPTEVLVGPIERFTFHNE